MEKAVLKEKERLKEEARKQKRLELNFKQLLKDKLDSLTEQSKWDDIKEKIENNEDYLALSSELDRIRLFDEYHRQFIADAAQQSHHHKRARKEKKKRKHEKTNSSVNFHKKKTKLYKT
jgi:pre-mRNA-processing factor 40